jgi:selenocysteine lyase/cysteine desulfurase
VRVVGLRAREAQLRAREDPRDRCATVSFVHAAATPDELCRQLAERGVFCWAGNSYALALSQALGLEPHGVLRIGLLHYHEADEVDRFLGELREVTACVRSAKP